MTQSIGFWRPVAVALAMSLFATTSPAGPRQDEDDFERTAALQTFNERVTAYAALHRHLAASIPIRGSRMDRQSILAGRVGLAAAIRNVGPHARQGDFFSPVVTEMVREIIGEAIEAGAWWTFTPPTDEEGRLLPGLHPRIYDPFPTWESEEIPAAVVHLLPTLPTELEYRMVDYDLVLWDICADLIVDVMPYAVAHPMSDFIYR